MNSPNSQPPQPLRGNEYHIYIHSADTNSDVSVALKSIAGQLTALIGLVTSLIAFTEKGFKMADRTLDEILADVQQENTLADSISTTVTQLLAKAAAVPGLTAAQQQQINDIATEVEANNVKLTAAVTAGTPAAAISPTATP